MFGIQKGVIRPYSKSTWRRVIAILAHFSHCLPYTQKGNLWSTVPVLVRSHLTQRMTTELWKCLLLAPSLTSAISHGWYKYIWSEELNSPPASFQGWPQWCCFTSHRETSVNPWQRSGNGCRSDSLWGEKWELGNQSPKTPDTTRKSQKAALIKPDCGKHKNIHSWGTISY